MTRILLVRHGATDASNYSLTGRTSGMHLNEEGRRQTEKLKEHLSLRKLAAIVSSPLERTLETAKILAANGGITVEVDSRFNELDFGVWQGKSFVELMKHPSWAEYNQYRSIYSAPGGESLVEVQGRAWKGVQSLCERFGESKVLVVTHADVIRSILMLALGMPPDNVLRLDIPPASLSEMSVGAGAPVVHRIGNVH